MTVTSGPLTPDETELILVILARIEAKVNEIEEKMIKIDNRMEKGLKLSVVTNGPPIIGAK